MLEHVQYAYVEFDEHRRRDEALQADKDDIRELESAIPKITNRRKTERNEG